MKALHVTPVFYPAYGDGGPVVAYYELCQSLAKHGCEIKVLTTDAHGWSRSLEVETEREIEIEPNFRVRYCKRWLRRSVAPALLWLLPRYIKWADVVHLQSVYNFPTIPTLIACKIFQKPVVWSPDGALQRWEGTKRVKAKTIWHWICRAISPRFLILHATSQREEKDCGTHFPRKDVMVISHSVPIPSRIEHAERGEVLRLLYIGRLDPIKGIENLVAACKLLNDRDLVSWSLTIAGDGEPEYTQKLRSKILGMGFSADGVEGDLRQVRMVGYVEGEAKERIFESADIVIVPSYAENFAMVVPEALVREVPVISSTGTPWQRMEEIGCGLWVANDPESLAKSIQQMSRMPLRRMGRRGREWVKERFSGDRVGRDMLRCYAEIFNRISGKALAPSSE